MAIGNNAENEGIYQYYIIVKTVNLHFHNAMSSALTEQGDHPTRDGDVDVQHFAYAFFVCTWVIR